MKLVVPQPVHPVREPRARRGSDVIGDRRARRSRRHPRELPGDRIVRRRRPRRRSGAAAVRPASSASSRPMPTDTARRGSPARSKTKASRCSRARTSRKASPCARPACARRSWCSARSSVSDLDGIFAHGLTPTISTPGAARALQAAAARHGVRLSCHLKIDTGMNRLGFRHDNLRQTLPEVAASPNLAIAAVYTHFATADNPDHPAFALQQQRFADGTGAARRRSASRRRFGTRPTARRCFATSGSGTTSCGRASCSTASFLRRWRRPCGCDLPCHSRAVSWR